MEKVVLVIPTYNRPKMLQQAIDSFVIQDYENKECIIIDDGSFPIASPHLPENGRVVRQENRGCPTAINNGILISTSDFICVLGDDDMLYDEKSLSSRIALFDKDTEMIYTRAEEVAANGEHLKTLSLTQPNKDKIWNTDYINIHSMMWRRSIHTKIGYFEKDMVSNEDWEFKIKCLMECKVKAADIITVKYRWHSGNKSMINHKNGIMGECKAKFMARLKERYANN